MISDTTFNRLSARYEEGRVPWDDPLPPPEVIETVRRMPAGRALDLGCGYGRAALYLAQHGWQVDGVDFIPQAIAEAARRGQSVGLSHLAKFHVAQVTDLHFLSGPYNFALDVGCMHSLDDKELRRYRDELIRLLPPGGLYLLFAHLRDDTAEVPGRGIYEQTIHTLFGPQFTLQTVRHGMTQVEDKPAWASAWFCFRRN
jgi:SAM-dependent methyltransferase